MIWLKRFLWLLRLPLLVAATLLVFSFSFVMAICTLDVEMSLEFFTDFFEEFKWPK